MKVYKPLPVLPGLTDESLSGLDSAYGRGLAELLLTIPPEYRQAALAEAHRRTNNPPTWHWGEGASIPMAVANPKSGVDIDAVQAEIIAEIRAQLGV
jgi:hypothetical protein